jgi:hypothetical protein
VRITTWKDQRIASHQAHRRAVTEFDEAVALGDQVEDHDALGPGLQDRRDRVGARRLVAPRRGEPRMNEDRADQAHDAQRLGQGVHQPAPTSMCKATGMALRNAKAIGERW